MFRWPDKKSLIAYIIVSLQLTVVFIVLYGFCNWLAVQRTNTFQLWMNWELAIPLLPWMILIYISLNLLTLVPLFTLDGAQIKALGKSMVISTFVAAVFFLLFPAHAGFTRTADVGIWSPFFTTLFSLDHTANTFPSLHITYSFLVVRSISSVNKKIAPLLWIWFGLICSSVLLVHQHHVIDIFGGVMLAEVCFRHFFAGQKITLKFMRGFFLSQGPDKELSQSPSANPEDSALS